MTKSEIEKIKVLNEKRSKPRALKYCQKHCKSCKNYCEKENYFIEQEILKYYIKGEPKTQQENNIQKNKDIPLNHLPPKINNDQIELVGNNKMIDQYLYIKEIKGDGNLFVQINTRVFKFRTIKTWIIMRNRSESNWNKRIRSKRIRSPNTNNPKNLEDQIRQEDSFVGETSIHKLAEKLKLTIAIYLKYTTKKMDKRKLCWRARYNISRIHTRKICSFRSRRSLQCSNTKNSKCN